MTQPSHAQNAPDPRLAPEKFLPAVKDTLSSRPGIDDRWLAEDKAAHFASSAFVTAAGFYWLRQEQDIDRSRSLLLSGSAALVLGIGKEIYDRRHPRHVGSWKDLLADVAGIGVALLVLGR